MSLKVLVIAEDPINDGYILRPLAGALLEDAGRKAAKVTVLESPRPRGFPAARKAIQEELPGRYAHFDLWLFFPDADLRNPDSVQDAMRRLESDLAEKGIKLLCCPVEPEVEILACVPFRDELGAPWDEIRAHPRLKEEVFEPLRKRPGDDRRAGGGRKTMIEASLRNRPALYRLCPEIKRLRDRIAEYVERQQGG